MLNPLKVVVFGAAVSLVFAVTPLTAVGASLRVSVMGDSYTSWKPSDLPGHYAQSCLGNASGYGFGFAGMTDVSQTYWMQFINHIGGVLEVNNAWECSCLTLTDSETQSGAGNYRAGFVNADRIDDIGEPDVLVICGGMNDAWGTGVNGTVELGEYQYSDWTSSDLKKFRPALAYLIDHQKTAHPNMEIVLVINACESLGESRGLDTSWCASMQAIAEHYGVLSVAISGVEMTGWHPTVAGAATMAAQISAAWDEAHPPVPAGSIEEADPTVRVIERTEGTVYVFTNTAATISFALDDDLTILKALVVGGGGEGGAIIGGGGGGGGVLELNDRQTVPAGTPIMITVGKGGETPAGPAGGIYNMNDAYSYRHRQTGANGAESVLTVGTTKYSVFGGGGGSSWDTAAGANGANGGGGAGENGGGKGYGLNGGHDGGQSYHSDAHPYAFVAGGGGGAGESGQDAPIGVSPLAAGRGGEGIESSITGEGVVYGSGGGGGGGNAALSSPGGTNGGHGGDGDLVNLVGPGQPGLDGTGAGGGGGGFCLGTFMSGVGGRGGNGTVILYVESSSQPGLRVQANLPAEDVAGKVSPALGYYSHNVGEKVALSAQDTDKCRVVAYAVETMGEGGVWGAPVTNGYAGGTVDYTQTESRTRVTWIYDLSTAPGPTAVASFGIRPTELDWQVYDAGYAAEKVVSAVLDWGESPDFADATSETVLDTAAAAPVGGTVVITPPSGSVLHVRVTAVNDLGNTSVTTFALDASPQTEGVTYCVGAAGSDETGTGSEARPFRTLSKALAKAVSGDEVRVSGVCSPSTGETFPIAVPAGVAIVGEDEAVLDGANRTAHLLIYNGGTGTFSGFELRNCTADAIVAKDCALTVRQVTVRQSDPGTVRAGGFAFVGDCNATVESCVFAGIARLGVIGQIVQDVPDDPTWSLAVRKCVFTNCAFSAAAVYTSRVLQDSDEPWACPYTQCANKFNITAEDCLFVRNTLPPCRPDPMNPKVDMALPAVAFHVDSGYWNRGTLLVERCRFIENDSNAIFHMAYVNADGDAALSRSKPGAIIRNSLFANNNPRYGMLFATDSLISFESCTFVNNGAGNYAGQGTTTQTSFSNCILDNAGPLLATPSVTWASELGACGTIKLGRCLVRNLELGDPTKVTRDQALLTEGDPMLDEDFVPLPYSPTIDALADESFAADDRDLYGNPRVADNDNDGVAAAEFGCCESVFWDAPSPTLRVPVPGTVNLLKGSSKAFDVSVSGAPADVPAPYAVTVSGGDGLAVEPRTFTLEDASDVQTVTVTVPAGVADEGVDLVLSAAGFLPVKQNLRYSALELAVPGGALQFARLGVPKSLSVSLLLDGTVPGVDVTIQAEIVSGAGSVAWESATANVIAADAHATGALHFTPAEGPTTVRFSTDAGKFSATGASTCDVTVVGTDGHFEVDPAGGSDETGYGSASAPFKTLAAALAIAEPGEEVRLWPGTYEFDGPVAPRGVAIVGWNAGAAAAAGEVIVSGRNATASLFSFDVGDMGRPGRLANLTLKDTTDALVQINGSSVTIEGCRFLQSVTNEYCQCGGIQLQDDSHLLLRGCLFSGIARQYVLYAFTWSNDHNRSIVMTDTTFENSSVWQAPFGIAGGTWDTAVTNCSFTGNTSVDGRAASDCYAPSALFLAGNGTMKFDRCRFTGNVGNHVMGVRYLGVPVEFSNSLFADCDSSRGTFLGYASELRFMNCTFCNLAGGGFSTRPITTRLYNCIVDSCDCLSSPGEVEMPSFPDLAGGRLELRRTLVYRTADGLDETYAALVSRPDNDCLTGDPRLRAKTFVPGLDSPVSAKANLDYVVGEKDLSGGPRLSGRGVDLGCFECAGQGLLLLVR